MKALVLAAGVGERLRPLTDKIPKAMIDVNRIPCLERALLNLKQHGIEDVAINTHHLPEQITEYFGNGEPLGMRIMYSYEAQLLGTSGALNNFRDFFDEPFLVVYGDVVANFDITALVREHKRNNALMTLVLDGKRDIQGKGVALCDGTRVKQFIEKPSAPVSGALINSGCYVVSPFVLDFIPQGFSDFGKNILPGLIAKGSQIGYVEHKGYVFDIGNRKDLARAEAYLKGFDFYV